MNSEISEKGEKVMNNLSLDKAVEMIFAQNMDEDYEIDGMSINGIDNTTDIFWFITKLFKEGTIYMFKKENGDVDLDSLTNDDFEKINKCMHRVGVNIELYVENITSQKTDILHHDKYLENVNDATLNVGMSYLVVNNDPSKLENHLLILYTRCKKIIIGYSFLATK